MATSIVLLATVVSDGLNCFTVAQEMGMAHDRTVTGSQSKRFHNATC